LPFIFLLSSCGEHGGIIVVKNNYSHSLNVTVYSKFSRSIGGAYTLERTSYDEKYGPKTAPAGGGSASFDVPYNGEYGVVWGSGYSYRMVKASNGDTVEVIIE
jgi:hypothetical protein